ncbi:MAG: hypothetical protein VXW65_05510 [Pseudomonadota bacterium]|nr:hypothetical protein [Pseudomonadota bacterium]
MPTSQTIGLTALFLSSLLLSACSKPADTPTDSTAEPNPAVATAQTPAVEAVQLSSLLPSQAYRCLPDQSITATYDQSNPQEPQAMLEIKGTIYILYGESETAAMYATDSGMQEGYGMKWIVQDNSATLTQVPHTGTAGVESVLYRCNTL